MRYMLLIYSEEKKDIQPGAPGWDALMADYGAFSREVREKGVYVDGDPLMDTSTAKTARVRNGEAIITAGPFAETAEQLGGYYILECKDIDEAAAFAAKVPTARAGSVEVRPILPV